MYYSSGNYEAFARPVKPEGVEHKSAYLVGSGLAALTAACYLVRDGQMPGRNIHILEKEPIAGGACDGWHYEGLGYVMRGGREMDNHFEVMWDLFRSIPSIETEGVSVLDERIFAEPGDMVVLGGYPSDGKTALALQFAFGIGKKHRVGFFSYESTRDKLFDRTVSRAAMLSYTKIKRNQLTEADYRDLLELRPQLTAPQLTLIDAAGMTVLDIQAYSQAHRYDVVFVDYLQKIAAPRGTRQSDFERVSAISSSLQQFGRITGTTVVALSQLSRPDRDAKTKKIRPPVLSDLRSSGQIEQDADVVLFLHREDYDDKQSNRILKIAKNKEGEAMDYVRFRFDGDLQTFSRIAPETPAPPAEKPKRERQPPRQVSFWADGGSFQDTPWGKGGSS